MTIAAIITGGLKPGGSIPWLLTEGFGFAPVTKVVAGAILGDRQRLRHRVDRFRQKQEGELAAAALWEEIGRHNRQADELARSANEKETADPVIGGYRRLSGVRWMTREKIQELERGYRERMGKISSIRSQEADLRRRVDLLTAKALNRAPRG